MRHVRDVIRLKSAGMPSREIARRVGTAPSTVRLTIRRFEASGLSWPLPDDVTDTVLEARLFAKAGSGSRQGQRRLAEPDWAAVHRELKRKHVTLSILWEEYIAGEPGGYRYSRFCELYRGWEGRLSVTMRQSHAAGDKLFVDYAGDGVPVVIDRLTGERRAAQIFVAVLGASSFTYAQATWTQGLADWISGHVGAFEAIDGAPARIKVLRCEIVDRSGTPGDLLDDHLTVACALGAIRILELQRAGKAPMKADDFLRGTPLKPPLRLA